MSTLPAPQPNSAEYRLMIHRLKGVQKLYGAAKAFELLKACGADNTRALSPLQYCKIIIRCEMLVLSALTYDRMIENMRLLTNKAVRYRSGKQAPQKFKDSVDTWYRACERELQMSQLPLCHGMAHWSKLFVDNPDGTPRPKRRDRA